MNLYFMDDSELDIYLKNFPFLSNKKWEAIIQHRGDHVKFGLQSLPGLWIC